MDNKFLWRPSRSNLNANRRSSFSIRRSFYHDDGIFEGNKSCISLHMLSEVSAVQCKFYVDEMGRVRSRRGWRVRRGRNVISTRFAIGLSAEDTT